MNSGNVLITGGADGLGRALALHYAREGLSVTVLDVDQARGQHLCRENKNISFLPFDLSAFLEEELTHLPRRLDIVICNAGISLSGNFVAIPFEEEREVFDVNTFGHMKLVKALLGLNKIAKAGRLAFVASASVYLPFPVAIAYASSKAALDGFALALEPYLFRDKISITRIYPGPIRTSHHIKYYKDFPDRQGGRPEKIAPVVARAIRKRKRKVFPDPLSKVFRLSSMIFPGILPRLCYVYCRKYGDKLFAERIDADD